MTIKEISPEELERLRDGGCFLLDVREPLEHAEERVAGSHLIPLGELESRVDEIERAAPIVILCRSGRRGRQALKVLEANGVPEAMNLEGGLLAWKASGRPLERSTKRRLPLMQQVQIVIGLGVLTGVVLSELAHPQFIYLSGFFGAGLLFAGLSGWCGLAKLIAMMPWNRVAAGEGGAASSCAVTN